MTRLFILSILLCSNISQAQLVDVVVEEVVSIYLNENDPVLYTSYRVYARLQDNTDRVMGVYSSGMMNGDSLHVLAIGTNAQNTCPHTVISSSLGALVGWPDEMEAYCSIYPAACTESFITLGGPTEVEPDDLNLYDTNALELSFGNCPNAPYCQPLYSDSAGWSVYDDIFELGYGGFPFGPDNRVLLFQILCPTGQLRFAINLWVYDAFGQGYLFYAHNQNQGPGQIGPYTEIDFTEQGLVYPLQSDQCVGCSDPTACNYLEWSTNTETCVYAANCIDVSGCMDPLACNFNTQAQYDFENSCAYPGCNDPLACNFNPLAGCDDGSCLYPGCMDPEACNYDSSSPCSDFSCLYPGCNEVFACNYDPEAGCNDGTCCYADDCLTESGCMDPTACNFNPNVICNLPETCEESGCMDETACNYNPNALCDNGSCFTSGITGYVFYDVNENGIWNQIFSGETGVWNIELTLMPEGITVFTDENGYFNFPSVEDIEHTIEVSSDILNWSMTTNPAILIDPSSCNELNVGITASEYSFSLSGPCCIWSMDIHCTNGFNPGVFINNLGTLPLNGTCTITCDPIFTFSPMNSSTVVDPDFTSPGFASWNIQNQNSFSSEIYQVHVNGPGAEYTGQQFDFVIDLALEDEQGNTFFSDSWVLNPTVLCSYDPNDKYSAEPGYTEESHFVLREDDIEYRIRFQNTGNFPAENVVILDTLDIEHLALESFEPIFASHNFTTQIEPNGAVTFSFPNIMLPDSTTNEPGSQGYVVYKIRPRLDSDHLDIIHNKAYIFFDENPAIITNETWHTIMDCDSLGGIVGDESCCLGSICEYEGPSSFIESYNWFVDGNLIGDLSNIEYSFTQSGTSELELFLTNPICSTNSSTFVQVNPLPNTGVQVTGMQLVAPEGVSWQWYFGETLIPGAIEQTYTPSDDNYQEGYFSAWVTNEFGCSGWSDEVYFLNSEEWNSGGPLIFPNPSNGVFNVYLPDSFIGSQLQIIDISGKIVYTIIIVSKSIKIDAGFLAKGVYSVAIPNLGMSGIKLIIE